MDPIANLSDSVVEEDKSRGRNLACLRCISSPCTVFITQGSTAHCLLICLLQLLFAGEAITRGNGFLCECLCAPEIVRVSSLDGEIIARNESLKE